MSDQINDGSMVIGSRVLAIGAFPLSSGAPTSPSNYATDDFSWDQASTETLRTDGNNLPTGRHVAKGPTTGTATLQLADESATVPAFGFGPLAPHSTTIGHPSLPCRPCHHHGPPECPLGHWKCMRELEVGVVERAVVETMTVERRQKADGRELRGSGGRVQGSGTAQDAKSPPRGSF